MKTFEMPRMKPFLLAAALLALAAPVAAQTGKIAGTITDAETGETLIGATVRVEGLPVGAATDIDGAYQIIGVRPGVYAVTVSYVGYQAARTENVRVRIDLTTTVDAALSGETVGGAVAVVTAGRQLFQKDVTATTASVSGDEIRAIPVENLADVVNLQAGVVNSGGETHFRGGRGGEVGYWVDGVPVSDVFNGGLSISLENESVQELQVVTGAFNAEYGQALSGIVNIVTRDGTNNVDGEIEVWAGDYAGSTSASAAGINSTDGITPSGLDLFPGNGLDQFSPFSVQNIEGAISGPILRDRLFFFTSGRHFANDGYLFGRNVFNQNDLALDPETGAPVQFMNDDFGRFGSGDSSLVSLNPYEKTSGQFKLTAQLPAGLRVSANLLLSQEDYRSFNFSYLFAPDAARQNESRARTTIIKLSHVLSSRAFYEIGLTNNHSNFRNFLYDDPLDARYRDNRLIGLRVPSLYTNDFVVGGTDNGRFERTTDTYLAKADLSLQLNGSNLVKTGIEARRHSLSFLDQYTFLQENFAAEGDADPAAPFAPVYQTEPTLVTNGQYDYKPTEFAAYVQDKIEIGGLIVNAGVRMDYFNSNGVVFRDNTDPATVFPSLRRCVLVVDGACAANPETGKVEFRDDPYTPSDLFQDASSTFQVSPRLGVAFPISATGVVHFSYGQFFQTPNFELLYQNPYFLLSSAGSGLIGLIGNANLKPEQTINGEIGLKQELTSSSAVELTAYYRDIRNLAGTATDPIQISGTSARYGRLVNSDFGLVRGVIFRFDQRVGRDFFAGLDYTYQVARANASDPALAYNAAAANSIIDRQIVRTDWDQRHTANASLTYSSARLGGGFGIIASYGSGTPYTPSNVAATLSGANPSTVVPLNSAVRPSSFNLNVNAYRNFKVTSGTNVQIYTKIDNVLDTRNETGIFGDTGRATYALLPNQDVGQFVGDTTLLQQRYVRPDFFSPPRRVVLGLRFQY